MAVTLTSDWQDVAVRQIVLYLSGANHYINVRAAARYANVSGNSAEIQMAYFVDEEYAGSSSYITAGIRAAIWYDGERKVDTGYQTKSLNIIYDRSTPSGFPTYENPFRFRVNGGSYGAVQSYLSSGGKEADASADVYMPIFTTPPTGLSVSNIVRNKDGFTATVSITDWGIGGSASERYRELQVWTNSSSEFVEPRRYQPQTGSELSGTITVNNSSSGGSLIIEPNTMYVIGAYASNGAANTGSIRIGQNTTLADELDAKSAEAIDIHSIKINYTTKADGGQYAKKIQYSLDNSTWVDGATVSTGSATSGSFNITGLKAGTQYTVYLRISTDAGITTSGSVTVKTKTACKIIRGDDVIEAIPYVIKPDGTKIELNVRKI